MPKVALAFWDRVSPVFRPSAEAPVFLPHSERQSMEKMESR